MIGYVNVFVKNASIMLSITMIICINNKLCSELTCFYVEFCPFTKENPVGIIHTDIERTPTTRVIFNRP